MAIWPWYGALAKGLVYDAGEFLQVDDYKNVQRWTDQLATRPAVKRGRMVNRVTGDPASQLRERHDASDFDLRTQDKLQDAERSEEHTSELQSLMRISYAVFCLKKKRKTRKTNIHHHISKTTI